ncbi:MAG: asparagine synthase [Desulfobacterales bacterium SG8_35_2]|jgi:asparagine synthase (glutamine-hydrolysing)|nr:MAG: asparagine synthase [Desulfobacterales bacterium SG8_35_2]
MCGFVGLIQKAGQNGETMKSAIMYMADALKHRGPDDSGVWVDESVGVGLGHRRLSILDLSAAGHQPMFSANGRYVIVYNGEIYNFAAIKKELEDCGYSKPWRGHSDTEVLLAAIEKWGVEEVLIKIIGMFAFALWDRENRILYLARDRMGEKPLYYGINNNIFLFGSELKALQRHPSWSAEVDRNALSLFLRFAYMPAPYSIFKGIYKLMPGTYLKLPLEKTTLPGDALLEPISYWSLDECVSQGKQSPFNGTDKEAILKLEILLKESIKGQMVADVPVGAFLSGGIDSSLITVLMQTQHSRPVKTFSIGFYEEEYNEANYAKAVAANIGTDHTELYLRPEEALAIIPDLPQIYDEPFADTSQIPTYLVSRLTKNSVTVSLSGDGGDELFCGYDHYKSFARKWGKICMVPRVLRHHLAYAFGSKTFSYLEMLLYNYMIFKNKENIPSNKRFKRFSEQLLLADFNSFYKYNISHWDNPAAVLKGSEDLPTVFDNASYDTEEYKQTLSMMMHIDALSYLPDDILVKVDRAAMAVSLETRVPFLDHRVIEFAWQLPISLKIRDDHTKWILKELLYKYVPKKLVDRPKKGFSVPIAYWLRGYLKEWAEELLAPSRLMREGYLKADIIHQLWEEHLSGRKDNHTRLWSILMFQSWLEKQTT